MKKDDSGWNYYKKEYWNKGKTVYVVIRRLPGKISKYTYLISKRKLGSAKEFKTFYAESEKAAVSIAQKRLTASE